MANTYYKFVNSRIADDYSNRIITELQEELKNVVIKDIDLYDMTEEIKSAWTSKRSLNVALWCYMKNSAPKDEIYIDKIETENSSEPFLV